MSVCADTKNCSVLLKAEFDISRTNSLRADVSYFPYCSGKVRNETERSHITLNGTNSAYPQ